MRLLYQKRPRCDEATDSAQCFRIRNETIWESDSAFPDGIRSAAITTSYDLKPLTNEK